MRTMGNPVGLDNDESQFYNTKALLRLDCDGDAAALNDPEWRHSVQTEQTPPFYSSHLGDFVLIV